MCSLKFKIADRGGYTYVVKLENPSDTLSHIKIIEKNGKDRERLLKDGLNALKAGILNDDRKVWEEAVLNSLEILNANNECSSQLKLYFLRDIILILDKTGFVYFTKPDLLKELIYVYWSIYKRNSSNEGLQYLAIDICERYLYFLENEANQDWFERKVLKKKEECEKKNNKKDSLPTRESEMEELASKLIQLRNLKGKFDDDQRKKIDQGLNRAKDMLMSWYNLKKGIEITTALQGGKIPKPLRRFISGWMPEIIGTMALAYAIWSKVPVTSKYVSHGLKHVNNVDPIIFSIYFLMACAFIVSVWKLSQKKKIIDFQIYLPRMAAGIIVGYIALLSDEAWGGIFGIKSGWFMTWRVVLPVIAVGFYILIEMSNVKGIRYPILGKAFRLLSRGVAYAVLTGMIVSDLFGKAIVRRIPETKDVFFTSCEAKPIHLTGLFGNIYPEVIFYIAPLALFIGVFVQLLWEDKTLTAKI